MPIVSFSISETLRNFIKSTLADKKKYNNQSELIRTALTRLMNDTDNLTENPASFHQIISEGDSFAPTTAGNIILVYKWADEAVRAKIHKCEQDHAPFIKSKTAVTTRNLQTILYVYEGSLVSFQVFTTALNSIKNIKNLRYIILE